MGEHARGHGRPAATPRHHSAAEKDSMKQKDSIKERALRELRSFVILFLYLWVLLGLFVLHEVVVAREHSFAVAPMGFALVNALVLAKVMLLLESVDVGRFLHDRRGIMVILFEAAVCTLLFLVCHVLERLIIDALKGSAIPPADLGVGGGGLTGALIVSLMMFVCLLPFFGFKTVARSIGMDRMRQILFESADRR